MEYKRTFLLRCCNTAIVRFRAQLIAYREPLCKWERGTPSGRCSPVGTWFGKQSLACSLAPFCPIGWVPWCNAQMAPLKWQPQLLFVMCAKQKGFQGLEWPGGLVESARVCLKDIYVTVPSFLNSEVILKRQ